MNILAARSEIAALLPPGCTIEIIPFDNRWACNVIVPGRFTNTLCYSWCIDDLVAQVRERREKFTRRILNEIAMAESVLGGEPDDDGSAATTLDFPVVLTVEEVERNES